MDLYLTIRMNEKLYLRNPEESELGRKILQHSIVLIQQLGFESFTFRKLAVASGTTEASIYRYFENKHRLLVYLVYWYWTWQEYRLVFRTQNLKDPEERLRAAIELLGSPITDDSNTPHINESLLHRIVMDEGPKSWLTHHVDADNRDKLFQPYKDICARLAGYLTAVQPGYPYPRSLASTIIEAAHSQQFYKNHLPSLTDFGGKAGDDQEVVRFLEAFVFSALGLSMRVRSSARKS